MKWRNITAKNLHKVVKKLDLEQTSKKRRSPHSVFWYYVDGRRELRITLPNVHGGSGSVSTGFLHQIKQSLRLTTRQFEDLVECPLTGEDYETIVREKLNL